MAVVMFARLTALHDIETGLEISKYKIACTLEQN
jgi:hypothetical protein